MIREKPMTAHNDMPVHLFSQLENILNTENVRSVFQPIVSLRDGSILGYEALSRGPVGTPMQNPDTMFSVAREYDKLWELELLCRSKALESVYKQDQHISLFLNVNPYVIHDELFMKGFTKDYLKRYNINPKNIIFEITEKSAMEDMPGFKRTIDHYKNQNYKIAIDDAGAGYSGLNMITDIHPHYIKLDIKLISNIDKDEYKKELVKSLYEFCRVSNVFLIAEGIETKEQLSTLINIGVHYGQGYYIQKPQEKIEPLTDEVLLAIKTINTQKNHVYFSSLSTVYVGNYCSENKTIGLTENASEVYNIFLSDPTLIGVTVVEGSRVAGMVTKTRINLIMSGQYGYSLHAKRPIADIMDNDPLIVDSKTPIDMVSKFAMSRPTEKLYDYIIVTKGDDYYGIVTIKDLLEKTMEIEVSNAKHQNPLSGLPGNLIIENHLTQSLNTFKPFTVLYFDIDNFKAFNDVYGFEKGDSVIRLVAKLLCDYVPGDEFIGHIGGDDFVAVLSSCDAQTVCDRIISKFDLQVKNLYKEEDLQCGYVTTKNRRGEIEQFPLMTLSIAGVQIGGDGRIYEDAYQISEKAVEIKKKCKQQWQSCYVID